MCILSLFAGGYHAQAEEPDSSQLAGGYTIEGIPSDHQLDKTVSYFYLKENPGEKDQVKVKLTNANTNSNGAVDYTGKIKDHASLKDPLTSMAKVSQKEVQVPAKSSVETAIDIQMPEKTMSGVVVGGIVVSEKQTVEKEKQAFSLGNIYTYTIGLVLTNEDTVEPKKNNSVELDTVGAKLSDGKKIVQADILNPNPYIFPDATVKGEIKPKDSGEVIKNEVQGESDVTITNVPTPIITANNISHNAVYNYNLGEVSLEIPETRMIQPGRYSGNVVWSLENVPGKEPTPPVEKQLVGCMLRV
ncbi:WxL protein peptidoglycan domain-containing protein [Enterococcus faecalis]|uniref:WxL protein peptidoglycan domain-containing protein n=1 Tax=Enterococcus faecalis TaxID=1351 RepID=UPI0035E527EB